MSLRLSTNMTNNSTTVTPIMGGGYLIVMFFLDHDRQPYTKNCCLQFQSWNTQWFNRSNTGLRSYNIAQNAYCSWDIYLLHGKNYRSVKLAVKRELNDSYWFKFTRALLRSEYRLADQLVRVELKDKGHTTYCSFYCFLIPHLRTVAE